MKTTIYLIRHGITDWNMQGRYQGSTDIPLNKIGLLEAKKLGKLLSHIPFKSIYSSPLIRAYNTAEEIAKYHNLPVQVMDELRERSYGEFEGMTFPEFKANKYFQKYLKDDWYLQSAPGGETIDEVVKRVDKVLSTVIPRHVSETIGIVAHGVVLKTIGYRIGYFKREDLEKVIVHNAQPHIIEYHHSEKRYNIVDFSVSWKK